MPSIGVHTTQGVLAIPIETKQELGELYETIAHEMSRDALNFLEIQTSYGATYLLPIAHIVAIWFNEKDHVDFIAEMQIENAKHQMLGQHEAQQRANRIAARTIVAVPPGMPGFAPKGN